MVLRIIQYTPMNAYTPERSEQIVHAFPKANLITLFGTGSKQQDIDRPTTFGDQTSWVHLNWGWKAAADTYSASALARSKGETTTAERPLHIR